jgi:serine/threonine-protein kinase
MTIPVEPMDDATRALEAEGRVGTTLRGKWHLDSLLGVGGMSAVYAATHRNGMRGAVKLLHPEFARTEAFKVRFLREGYLANRVDHPSVVRVLDDDVTDDGRIFLVMELLDGQALDQVAASAGGTLSPQEVLRLAFHALSVLKAAHDRGIVHRDIKPENLFLTGNGYLKVLDFGMACVFEETAAGSALTQAGVVMGTPAFMPPEQARGRWNLVDAQSDLWSLGATMFTLLTGDAVHGIELTPAELVAASFMRPPRSLAEVLPDAPPEIVAIVDRALQRDKTKRWLDARSMREAIVAATALCSATRRSGGSTHAACARRSSRRTSPCTACPSTARLGRRSTAHGNRRCPERHRRAPSPSGLPPSRRLRSRCGRNR